MSQGLLWILLISFVICASVAIYEGRYGLGLYWAGASVIQVSLIVGMK